MATKKKAKAKANRKVRKSSKKKASTKKKAKAKASTKARASTKAKAKSRKSLKGRKKSAPAADRRTLAKSTAGVSTKSSSAKSAKPASKLPSTGSVSKAFPKDGQARNLASAEKMDELFSEGKPEEEKGPAPPMFESLLVVRAWLNEMPVEFIKKQVAKFVYKGEQAGYPCHVIHSACKVSVQALTRDGVPTVEVHSPGHPVWSESFGSKPFAGLGVPRSHFNEMASRWMELIDYYIELETERGKAKAG